MSTLSFCDTKTFLCNRLIGLLCNLHTTPFFAETTFTVDHALRSLEKIGNAPNAVNSTRPTNDDDDRGKRMVGKYPHVPPKNIIHLAMNSGHNYQHPEPSSTMDTPRWHDTDETSNGSLSSSRSSDHEDDGEDNSELFENHAPQQVQVSAGRKVGLVTQSAASVLPRQTSKG